MSAVSRQKPSAPVLTWDALAKKGPGRLRPCANDQCHLFLIDHSTAGTAKPHGRPPVSPPGRLTTRDGQPPGDSTNPFPTQASGNGIQPPEPEGGAERDRALHDQTVLVVGRGGGIARAITVAARDAGAQVVAAGRDRRTLAAVYAGEPGITTETVDLTDEASIAALGRRLGTVGHVVSTASAQARGRIADLDRDAIMLSFYTEVVGPFMLAKQLAPRMPASGSFVLFSGVAAAKITVGTLGVAITNGAADVLARSLALELAPIRVNAISPGVIDTGAWDALGKQGKADYFADMSARNPARRIGTADDIANGVLFAMTSPFLTGVTLHIDGGEPLT